MLLFCASGEVCYDLPPVQVRRAYNEGLPTEAQTSERSVSYICCMTLVRIDVVCVQEKERAAQERATVHRSQLRLKGRTKAIIRPGKVRKRIEQGRCIF